jgi:hypothetical protein
MVRDPRVRMPVLPIDVVIVGAVQAVRSRHRCRGSCGASANRGPAVDGQLRTGTFLDLFCDIATVARRTALQLLIDADTKALRREAPGGKAYTSKRLKPSSRCPRRTRQTISPRHRPRLYTMPRCAIRTTSTRSSSSRIWKTTRYAPIRIRNKSPEPSSFSIRTGADCRPAHPALQQGAASSRDP